MDGYVKELKNLEKSKELNQYFKSMILKHIEKYDYPEIYKRSIKEMLEGDGIKRLEKFYTFIDTEAKADNRKILRVGILENDEYDVSPKEYIYGTEYYDLGGGLAEIYVVKNEKLSRDIPPITFVCEGATLKCTSRGSITSLKVMDGRREILNGAKIATKADKTLAEIDFKKCGKSSCNFSSGGGWQEVSVGAMSNDHMQLLNTSYIMCDKGSKIIIEDANCEEKGN